jgi:hypothetical protein
MLIRRPKGQKNLEKLPSVDDLPVPIDLLSVHSKTILKMQVQNNKTELDKLLRIALTCQPT